MLTTSNHSMTDSMEKIWNYQRDFGELKIVVLLGKSTKISTFQPTN